MRGSELTTLDYFYKSYWLLSRQEQERFRSIVMKWKKTNRDASIFHEMLVESVVRLHLIEQRLVNQTTFMFGETTDYRYIGEQKRGEITTEDAARKQAEFDKYFFNVIKHKTELLKLAMANSINLNITEDGSIHSIFSALSETERSKLDRYKGNGVGRSHSANNGQGQTETI
jgi:translation initiation factor 2 alpha subunit (eIF-2alpha)